MIYLFKQAGANTVGVSERVQEALAEINRGLRDAELTIRYDKSEFILDAIGNVKTSAIYGMGLAVVVLILFLHSFRSTLVIAVSMPLSVLFTFVLIYFNGLTLNLVSFGGLALGIGLLVDNSIVVLESIFRHRENGVEPKEAAIRGTNEVASAIVASTITTLIVFVPLLFIQGTTGVLLHQLATVVTYSLMCSLGASLTLTPVLAAFWIKDELSPGLIGRVGATLAGGFHAITRRVTGTIEQAYLGVLSTTLKHPGFVGFLLLLILSVTLGLYPLVGSEISPQDGRRQSLCFGGDGSGNSPGSARRPGAPHRNHLAGEGSGKTYDVVVYRRRSRRFRGLESKPFHDAAHQTEPARSHD